MLTVNRHFQSAGGVNASDIVDLSVMEFGRCLSIAMVTMTSRSVLDNLQISDNVNGRGVFTMKKIYPS